MQFSAWPSPTRSMDEILARAAMADADGWYGMWFADHYMPNTGTETVADGDSHECWAVLPAVAATTSRIRLGPLVSPTTVHHPAILANRAASIDHVSNGRFVLGIGAGWQINEHGAYGIELPPPGQRVDRFEEAIQIVRSMLSEQRTTFAGKHYQITEAPCDPKPVQAPLPLLVGTGSPRMLRITARHADEWNTWGDPTVAGERTTSFLAACEAVGRDPSSMHRSVQAMLSFVDDESERDAATKRAIEGRTLIGSPAEIVDAIGAYRELGFDEFILPDFNQGPDRAARDEIHARFHDEVMSAFSS